MKKPKEKTGTIDERIIRALQRTWEVIGYDFIQANGGNDVLARDVREAVPDYLHLYGDDKGAEEAFRKLSFKVQEALLKRAFPLRSYGG